jgi:hypothetical protein
MVPGNYPTVTAYFVGDASFMSSGPETAPPFTITQASTTTALSQIQFGGVPQLVATVSANGSGAAPTGMLTFSAGGTVLGTELLSALVQTIGGVQNVALLSLASLAAGQYNITATYAGDANYAGSVSSPVNVNLKSDFSLANQGIPTVTVTAGQLALFVNDVVVTPIGGFAAPVNLTCSVPAPATTCTVNPPAIATGSGIASVSVTTTAPSAAVLRIVERVPWVPFGLIWSSALAVFGFLLSLLLRRFAESRQRRWVGALAVGLLLVIGGVAVAGCGGGGSGAAVVTPPPKTQATPAGSYVVTVTGTSGTLTHSMTLTLVVQ